VRQADLELGQEVGLRQVALDAVPLCAVRLQDEGRRGPLRAEALEDLRLLLDVSAVGDEVVGDELGNCGSGIDLGFQPSASPSHGCGGEVDEQELAGALRLLDRRVDVSVPVDLHGISPFSLSRFLVPPES
jgi:hypothetical protein